MKHWEYTIVDEFIGDNSKYFVSVNGSKGRENFEGGDFIQILNKLAAQGWEAVGLGVIKAYGDKANMVLLKREAK